MKSFNIVGILSFLTGSLLLISCSFVQKLFIGADPFLFRGYIVPMIMGGVSGLTIGYLIKRWTDEKLRVKQEKLNGVIEMAGAVCHEMNQPMQVISGLSEILLMDLSKENPLYPDIQKINSQVKRMGRITGKLMNITRYETKDYLKGKIVDIDRATK